MVKSIVIITKENGSQQIVENRVMPKSEALEKLHELSIDDGIKAELFDLRSPTKRRKYKAKVEVTEELIIDKLLSGVELSEDDFTSKGIPKTEAFNKLFETNFKASEVASIWKKFEKEIEQNSPE